MPKASSSTSHPPRERKPPMSIEDRARLYLGKMPPAVAGSQGHNATFHAACALVIGFNLDGGAARRLLAEWNQHCQPPWSEKELDRKIREAEKERGRCPQDVGKFLSTRDRDGIRSAAHRGTSTRSSAEKKTSHSSADAALVRPDLAIPSSEQAAFSDLSAEFTIEREPVKRIEEKQTPPAESRSEPVPSVPPVVEAACHQGAGLPKVACTYGSKRALWNRIQEAVREAGRGTLIGDGRRIATPNVLRVDPSCVDELPAVIDGMAVRPGRPGEVSVGSCWGIEITGTSWIMVQTQTKAES